MKEAQVTYFVLIGMVLVIVVMLMTYIVQSEQEHVLDKQLYQSTDRGRIQIVAQSCIELITQEHLSGGVRGVQWAVGYGLEDCLQEAYSHLTAGFAVIHITPLDDTLDMLLLTPVTEDNTDYDDIQVEYPLVSTTSLQTDESGSLGNKVKLASPDRRLSITIPKGTKVWNADGSSAKEISIRILDRYGDSDYANIAGRITYIVEPEITFHPAAILDFMYDDNLLVTGIQEHLLNLARIYKGYPILLEGIPNPSSNTISSRLHKTGEIAAVPRELVADLFLDNYYTSDNNLQAAAIDSGYQQLGTVGYLADSELPGTNPLRELYDPKTRLHYYTHYQGPTDLIDNRVLGYVFTNDSPGLKPLYQLVPLFGGNPILTSDPDEMERGSTNLQKALNIIFDGIFPEEDKPRLIGDIVTSVSTGNQEELMDILQGLREDQWKSLRENTFTLADIDNDIFIGTVGYVYESPHPESLPLHRLRKSEIRYFFPYRGIIETITINVGEDNDFGLQPLSFSAPITGAFSIVSPIDVGFQGLGTVIGKDNSQTAQTIAELGMAMYGLSPLSAINAVVALARGNARSKGIAVSESLSVNPNSPLGGMIDALTGQVGTAIGMGFAVMMGIISPVTAVVAAVTTMAVSAFSSPEAAIDSAATDPAGIGPEGAFSGMTLGELGMQGTLDSSAVSSGQSDSADSDNGGDSGSSSGGNVGPGAPGEGGLGGPAQ